MPKIFISYRRADSADAAGRIYDRLVNAFGSECIFKDVDSIPPGTDFSEVIAQRLGDCQAVIVVIGRSWLLSKKAGAPPRLHEPDDFVRLEIEFALGRKLLLVPALVGKSSMPDAAQLPKSLQPLARRNALPVRPDPDFHRDMDRLIDALQKHFGAKRKVEPPPIPPSQPPQGFACPACGGAKQTRRTGLLSATQRVIFGLCIFPGALLAVFSIIMTMTKSVGVGEILVSLAMMIPALIFYAIARRPHLRCDQCGARFLAKDALKKV